VSPVPPAFVSNRQAWGFVALVAILLLSPVVLRIAGLPSRAETYKATTLEAGDYPFLEQQMFEEHSDLDVVFVCSSLLAAAIDAPTFQHELSRHLGREANVVLLGTNWQGMDLQYVLLRDLLDHRRARMVVMSMPIPEFTSDRPHVQAYRWLRFGDFPEVLSGLPALSKTILYGDYVLGSPRQWLSRVRPSRVDPALTHSRTFGTHYKDIGYYGAPFVTEDRTAPAIPAQDMIYAPDTAAKFNFHGKPLGPYQLHFAQALAGPIQQSGAWLTLVHVTEADERGSSEIPERMYWPDIVPAPMSIAGVPDSVLFAGKTDEQYYRYFFDQHMNTNGKMLFTRAITPALISIYDEHTRQERVKAE